MPNHANPALPPSSRALLLGLLCTAGCYLPYYLRPGEPPPATATVSPDQRTATWNRAISVLVASGWVPQLLSEPACFIGAKRRDAERGAPAQTQMITG
jgi:hypothetical protein